MGRFVTDLLLVLLISTGHVYGGNVLLKWENHISP